MSKVMNPYGTDNVLKKKAAKNIIEALYGKTDLKKMYDILSKGKTEDLFAFSVTRNELFLFKNPNSSNVFNPSKFEEKIYRLVPEDYTKENKERLKVVFEIIKNNALLQLYNYGKIPKNLKGKLYKSVKNLFKEKDHQKEIIALLNDETYSVKELSDKIYSLLKKEGYSTNEISMKIKDINQVLRIKRIREISEDKEDKRLKVSNVRDFLTRKASAILDLIGEKANSKNMKKIKNIIKSYSTYSLNMPLIRKLKKEFPNALYVNLKEAERIIKENITEKYNLEEALLIDKTKRVFDNELVENIQGKNNKEASLNKKINHIIDNYFKDISPEDILMDSEHRVITKTFDFYKKNFLRDAIKKVYDESDFLWDKENLEKDNDSLIKFLTHQGIPMLKSPTSLFAAYLKKKYSKEDEEELYRYMENLKKIIKRIANTNFSSSLYPSKVKWLQTFAKKHIEEFESFKFNSFEELEKILFEKITEDMNLKDTISFSINYEIFKTVVDQTNLDVNFKKNFGIMFEFLQRNIRKSMLLGSLSGEEDALGKEIIKYLYNYYYGFLFKEEKFWEKIPYFVNTEFLKAIRELAFKNEIKIDNSLVKEFKKKYALKILSKIEKIDKRDIRAIMQKFTYHKRFAYSMLDNFTPYNITLSGEKINRDFVENLEDFFYLNISTLNLPSYDSLVSLSREYGDKAVNNMLDSAINGIKEKTAKRNFQKEYYDIMKNGDGLYYKNLKKYSSIYKSMIFYNFDKVKEFVNKAIKELKINLSEYNDKNLETFIKKIRNSIKEDIKFAPVEIEILKKAEEIAKEHTDIDLKNFSKQAGWREDESFNFVITFKRKLESLLSLYPEEEKKDLSEMSFMLEKYLRGEIKQDTLTHFLSETFLVEGSNLREVFISLSKILKESINTAEIKTAFLIEDTIEDIYGAVEKDKSIEKILEKIKNEKIKEAILNFDTSALDEEYKAKVEEFLFKGKIEALKEIADIEEKSLEKVKFDIAGITERNPLVKTFRTVIKEAKNLLFSDVLLDKSKYNKLRKEIADEEVRFHDGNIIIKLDKDYIFKEIKNRFINDKKEEFISFIQQVEDKFEEDFIEISTKKIEEYLKKIFIEQTPLSSKESMELFTFSKVVYPKLAVLQGTHDVMRSNGAFTFFTINNSLLRDFIHNYTGKSLSKTFKNSYSLLFSDIKTPITKEPSINHIKQVLFRMLMNEGLSTGLKDLYFNRGQKNRKIDFNSNSFKTPELSNGIITPSANEYALAIYSSDNVRVNVNGVLEEKRPLVLSEKSFDVKTYQMLFGDKTFYEMNKEDLRNFLMDSLSGFLNIDSNEVFSTFKSKLYFLHDEVSSVYNDIQRTIEKLNKLLNDEDILSLGGNISESIEIAAALNGIKKRIESFLKVTEDNSQYEHIRANLQKTLKEEIKKSEQEMQNILNGDIDSKMNSFKIFKSNIENIKNAITETIEQINRFEIAAINIYCDKIAQEGWDYKDLIFLKENLAMLNDVIVRESFINYANDGKYLSEFYKIELKKRETLNEKIFEKHNIDETLKNALLLYQIDQFYKNYAYGFSRKSKNKYVIIANENQVKKDKKHLYLNTATLSSFSTRPGELVLMPESHFINRSIFGKDFVFNQDSKLRYYATLYTFGGEYRNNKKFVNVDKLRNKVFDSYAIHYFLNDLSDINTINDEKIDELSIEKISDSKVKIKMSKKSIFLSNEKNISIIVPIDIKDWNENYIFSEPFDDNYYFALLLKETKVINSNSPYDENYPYETLLSLVKKAINENKKIEIKEPVGLYIKDYKDKNLIKNFLNFYSKMNIRIRNLAETIKKDPSVYPKIIDNIKNAYQESVKSELIKIVNIKESIKEKIKEIKILKESYPDYLLEMMKKDIEKLKNDFIKETSKKTTKALVDYTENIEIFNLNDKKTASKINDLVSFGNFFTPTYKRRQSGIINQFIRKEREFVKKISPEPLNLIESKIIAGETQGYIDIKEKRLVTRGEIIYGKENGILVNSEHNKTFSISSFEKEMKKFILMKQTEGFSLLNHFDKVKQEFENAYGIQEIDRNKNIKDIN